MSNTRWTIVDLHRARFGAVVLENHPSGRWQTTIVYDEDYAQYYSKDNADVLYSGTDAAEAQYVYGEAVLRAVGVLA